MSASNVPAVRDDEHLAQAAAATPHPYEDEAMRRRLRRNRLAAVTIARMSGLNPSLIGETLEQTTANVEAVGLFLAPFGVELNPVNVQQFDQIPPGSGQMVPRCQLLMALVSELTGDEIWADDDNDDTKATVYLKRSDTGRVYKATYTIDQARRSHALDFWFEEWKSASSGKRYLAQRVVVGTEEAEVYANRNAWPSWAQGDPKCNPAWHGFREDMLERRAFKRVIKRGRPGVTAGVLFGDRPPIEALPTSPTITVNMDYEGDERPQLGPGGDVVDEEPGERYEVQEWTLQGLAGWGVWDTVNEDWTGGWFAEHIRMAADAMAAMLNASLATTEVADAARGTGEPVSPGRPHQRHEESEPGPSGDAQPATRASSSTDRPLPLPAAIARAAKDAGVDRHHLILAVTCGEKSSAKDVEPGEEADLVFQAIEGVKSGKYVLVERGGNWILSDPPLDPSLFSPDDPGRPFE